MRAGARERGTLVLRELTVAWRRRLHAMTHPAHFLLPNVMTPGLLFCLPKLTTPAAGGFCVNDELEVRFEQTSTLVALTVGGGGSTGGFGTDVGLDVDDADEGAFNAFALEERCVIAAAMPAGGFIRPVPAALALALLAPADLAPGLAGAGGLAAPPAAAFGRLLVLGFDAPPGRADLSG